MRNSGFALRKAIFSLINGNIIVRGSAVPVFAGTADITTNKPYIVLGEQTASDISGKSSFSDDRTILIDIITSTAEGITGPAESEDIADQVCRLICPLDTDNWPDVAPDFQITVSRKIQENDLVEGSATEIVYRKLIRFRYQVHELTPS